MKIKNRDVVLVSSAALFMGALSCTTETAPQESDVSALTDTQLAESALRILGARRLATSPNFGVDGVTSYRTDGSGSGRCGTCHSLNQSLLVAWAQSYQGTFGPRGSLRTSGASQTDRINRLRDEPSNGRSPFVAKAIGLAAAGIHFTEEGAVSAIRHPNTYEQVQLLAELFRGRPTDLKSFVDGAGMPYGGATSEDPAMTVDEYETVLSWTKKGLPDLARFLPDSTSTVPCVPDMAGLRDYAMSAKNDNWMVTNRDNQMPMFACPSLSAPADTCFQSKRNGVDVFPVASTQSFGRGWAQGGTTVRILRNLGFRNKYWARSSADGRFVGNQNYETGNGTVTDLAAAFAGLTRDVVTRQGADPEFFPDNTGFMFPGLLCKQSLLTNPATSEIMNDDPGCMSLTTSRDYQTVGQTVGDNSVGDRFIISSGSTSDDGNANGDTAVFSGSNSTLTLRAFAKTANDSGSGYRALPRGIGSIPIPYRGDVLVSRSGRLSVTRRAVSLANISAGVRSAGYQLDRLTATRSGDAYSYSLTKIGTVCEAGNKASLSYDERFLTSHHYLPKTPSADWSSEIWITDFITGRTTLALKMNPGQNAKYPHFRSDGWLYVLVNDFPNGNRYIVASDVAIRLAKAVPTP